MKSFQRFRILYFVYFIGALFLISLFQNCQPNKSQFADAATLVSAKSTSAGGINIIPGGNGSTSTSANAANFSCAGTGTLASYSLTGSMTVSAPDRNKIGYYFVVAYDIANSVYYSFDGTSWALYDQTSQSVRSLGQQYLSTLSGTIFSNGNLSAYPNAQIYLGYGVGDNKEAAWQDLLVNSKYQTCVVLPAQ